MNISFSSSNMAGSRAPIILIVGNREEVPAADSFSSTTNFMAHVRQTPSIVGNMSQSISNLNRLA